MMATRKSKKPKVKSHQIQVEGSNIPLIIIEDLSVGSPKFLSGSPSLINVEEDPKLLYTFSRKNSPERPQHRDFGVESNKRKNATLGVDDIDKDDLRALVYAGLPSARKRRESVLKRDSGRRSKEYQMDEYLMPPELIGELADTILNRDDVFIDSSSDIASGRKSFTDRIQRMSWRFDPNYSLHSRFLRRTSRRASWKSLCRSSSTDEEELLDQIDYHRGGTLEAREAEGIFIYPKKFAKRFRSASETLSGIWYRINFWSQQFKEIEGQFGIATTTYFRFARWLVKINFVVFFLFLCFLYIPQLSHDSIFKEEFRGTNNMSESYTERAFRCSSAYSEYIKNTTEDEDGVSLFADIAQGTGSLENSMLFYGYYSNLTFWISGEEGHLFDVKYNMGLAYILTVGFSFIIVFIMIVRNSSRTMEETVMDFDNKAFPLYTNAVFSGWDYCINRQKTAYFKQKIIFNELKATLEEVEFKRKRDNRSARERTRLYIKRIFINLIVLAILVISFYAIYITTDFLLEKSKENLTEIVFLLVNFLPSIVISVLNVVIPEVFLVLSDLEEYTHSFATHITIIRAVFLRLSSVGVLIVSLYIRLQYQEDRPQISCPEELRYNATRTKCCGNILWQSAIGNDSSGRGTVKCWETYVGQQFYKLAITDFISVTLVALLIKIPRKFIYNQLKNKFWVVHKLGMAKFDLPIQVLDILYTQTLCWMGMFFTPLYPAISCVIVFIYFFLKKFELVSLSDPPVNAYRASRSYSFFQTVLLISFIMISCLLGYMLGNFQPSMSCGPFRLYSSSDFVMFDVLTNEINSWPEVPRGIVKYFGTVAFYLPAFLILLLGIYYYWAISAGYKKMEELLKEQLRSEAHDKQYLLARVDEIIKRGELDPADYR